MATVIASMGLFVSCSSEEGTADTTVKTVAPTSQSKEVIAFQNAFILAIKSRNRSTDKSNLAEVKDNPDLMEAAKSLMIANGMAAEAGDKSDNANAVILSKALRVMAEKTKIQTIN